MGCSEAAWRGRAGAPNISDEDAGVVDHPSARLARAGGLKPRDGTQPEQLRRVHGISRAAAVEVSSKLRCSAIRWLTRCLTELDRASFTRVRKWSRSRKGRCLTIAAMVAAGKPGRSWSAALSSEPSLTRTVTATTDDWRPAKTLVWVS